MPVFYIIALCRWHDVCLFHLQEMTKWMVPLLWVLSGAAQLMCLLKNIGRPIWFRLDLAGLNTDSVFLGWLCTLQRKENFWGKLLMFIAAFDSYPLFQWIPKCIKKGACTRTQELRSAPGSTICSYLFSVYSNFLNFFQKQNSSWERLIKAVNPSVDRTALMSSWEQT